MISARQNKQVSFVAAFIFIQKISPIVLNFCHKMYLVYWPVPFNPLSLNPSCPGPIPTRD